MKTEEALIGGEGGERIPEDGQHRQRLRGTEAPSSYGEVTEGQSGGEWPGGVGGGKESWGAGRGQAMQGHGRGSLILLLRSSESRWASIGTKGTGLWQHTQKAV